MPARLSQGDGCLVLKLGGTKDEFASQLARAKAVAGRRYNAGDKTWEFPDSDESLLKVVYTVEPDLSAEIQRRVQTARQSQAESLLTALPDDAPVCVPWQARLAGKQRSAIAFGAKHGRVLLADDMGAGKSVESISIVYEYLIQSSNEDMRQVREAQTTCGILPESPNGERESELLQSVQQSRHAGKGSTQSSNDLVAGEGPPMCGLRGEASSGGDGVRPHSGEEKAVRCRDGGSTPFEGRDSEVRGSLPQLPSYEALPGGPFLVIAPNSVMGHWKRELEKWVGFPPSAIQIVDGKTKKKREEQLNNPDAIWFIVNWEKLQERVGLVVGNSRSRGPLEKIEWQGIIADECHRFKNHQAQIAKAMYQLHAPVQVAASGTPILNNPAEIWSNLHWLQPEIYTSYWKFFHSYTEFYEGYKGKPTVIGVKNPDALRFELADKMIRRTKRQIHPDIPEPFEPIVYEPPMGPEQAKLYAKAEEDFWLEIAQAAADPDDPTVTAEKVQDLLDAQIEGASPDVLRLMIPNAATRTIRMRQIATSPAVLGGPDASSKLDDIVRVVGDSGDRPWAFFAWYQPSVELLVARFEAAGLTVRGFHGDNSTAPERTELAREFQDGAFQIIVASIGTGGQGIEFYRAADCGFLEEDWVPGINNQAFDRVDRKGQKQRPQRHIWRTPGTVDTGRIAPKNATKQLIVETILGRS